MNNTPIGIFDSGVGGLSVLAHIRRRLPAESLHYVADSAFAPYGCKPVDIVQQRCLAIAEFFHQRGCKALVVACNTATAAAIHQLRATYDMPIIGMEPAIKPGLLKSRRKRVGVMVTRSTANSEKFNRLINRFEQLGEVIVQPCPGLVEAIESGRPESRTLQQMLRDYILPLIEQGVDTLILGCSHYPLVIDQIRSIAGRDILILETGSAIAEQLKRQLHQHNLLTTPSGRAACGSGEVSYWSSSAEQTSAFIASLWGDPPRVNPLPL